LVEEEKKIEIVGRGDEDKSW